MKMINTEEDTDHILQIRFKAPMWEELSNKAEWSGLDRASYIKLLLTRVDIRATANGRFVDDEKRVDKLFKKEQNGLGIAEAHALKALSKKYNPLLALNELLIFNRGWTRSHILAWCDKYGVKPLEFNPNKPIALVIIRAYFEIEPIFEKKRGMMRGRYRMSPDYTQREMNRYFKEQTVRNAAKFDRLIKKVEMEEAKSKDMKEHLKLLADAYEINRENEGKSSGEALQPA